MLIIKIYINEREIDQIHIQNMATKLSEEGLCDYKIRLPKNIDKIIKHKRTDGYRPLLIKALKELKYENNMNKNSKKVAEKLLETLYEKMFFRGPLPEEGWAIEKICKTLITFNKIKNKEKRRV